MADTHFLPLKKCEEWLKNFKVSYPVFSEWAQKISNAAKLRGWINNSDNRIRFTNDSNSKGLDGAGERMAVNARIQGLAASITKRAQINILKAYQDTPARMLLLCHDEVVVEVPGKWTLNVDKSFDDEKKVFKPKFDVDEEAIHWASIAEKHLVEAEEYYFKLIRPDLELDGLCESEFAPYWAH